MLNATRGASGILEPFDQTFTGNVSFAFNSSDINWHTTDATAIVMFADSSNQQMEVVGSSLPLTMRRRAYDITAPPPTIVSAVESSDYFRVLLTFNDDTDLGGEKVGLQHAFRCTSILSPTTAALFGPVPPSTPIPVLPSLNITTPLSFGPVCVWTSARHLVVLAGVSASLLADGQSLAIRPLVLRAANQRSLYATASAVLVVRTPSPVFISATLLDSGAGVRVTLPASARTAVPLLTHACKECVEGSLVAQSWVRACAFVRVVCAISHSLD